MATQLSRNRILYPKYAQYAKHGFIFFQENSMAWPFLEPIDTTEEPNYLRIVKTPMGKCVSLFHFLFEKMQNFICNMANLWLSRMQ